jgi:hypothetical protein
MGAYFIAGAILDIGDSNMNKTDKAFFHASAYSLMRRVK